MYVYIYIYIYIYHGSDFGGSRQWSSLAPCNVLRVVRYDGTGSTGYARVVFSDMAGPALLQNAPYVFCCGRAPPRHRSPRRRPSARLPQTRQPPRPSRARKRRFARSSPHPQVPLRGRGRSARLRRWRVWRPFLAALFGPRRRLKGRRSRASGAMGSARTRGGAGHPRYIV